jgi:hypothetical protein
MPPLQAFDEAFKAGFVPVAAFRHAGQRRFRQAVAQHCQGVPVGRDSRRNRRLAVPRPPRRSR